MNLFIDAVSNTSILIVFDDNREIIDREEFIIKWNESSSLIPNIDNFLKKNNLEYNDLENIVVVNWPWSFTWIRTIVLVVNTINYIIWKNITPLNYFDLFNNYPIIKSSSKRDSFFKENSNSKIQIVNNNELYELLKEWKIKEIYWEANNEFFDDVKILDKIDYSNIIKTIKFEDNKKIEALYIKKPNIS